MASDYLNNTQNLVHPDWEVVDPTPDIHVLFPIFDRKFFQGKLLCVELEWSKRMYSCAGICYQRTNRFGRSCTIRLSEPLLKLRSRKDLVETLLHEMIHAYCFVLGIREGNGGHGPHFKKIMNGINRIAGTNITVYHTFHDEVKLYKTHWWKCNGVCHNRAPFYGTVKRTANRKPGPSDFWWAEHQRSCGGEFIKIKEPEPKRKKAGGNKENEPRLTGSQGKKGKSPIKAPDGNRISDYFNSTGNATGTTPQNTNGFKKPYTATAPNIGGRTVVIRKPPSTSTTNKKPSQEPVTTPVKKPGPIVAPGSNLKNVKQFKDLIGDDGSPSTAAKNQSPPLFSGRGETLGVPASGPSRVGQPGNARNSRLLTQFPPQEKKPRIEPVNKPPESAAVVVDLSDDADDYIFEEIDLDRIKKERQDSIRKEIMASFADDDMEEIVLIDDEYDDEAVDLVSLDDSLTDTSVIDELFGDQDALIEEFNSNNSKVKPDSEEDEIVSCPMCLKKIKRSQVSTHLERCYSVMLGEDDVQEAKKETFDPNQPSTSKAGASSKKNKKLPSKKETEREENRQLLKECGYSEEDIAKALATMEQEDEAGRVRNASESGGSSHLLDEGDEIDLTAIGEQCECPVCGRKIQFEQINRHLDGCLGT
ncbi:DNA-dependent metalloprotease dvc-1 [Ochlerotatus camptorhynchus]|uniref:DNA-dependent metalloprotease dvc-1 n=1 Tax=Ochlerotatus camptorhynchus TaxID=644619 RepID=UPI0031CDE4B7